MKTKRPFVLRMTCKLAIAFGCAAVMISSPALAAKCSSTSKGFNQFKRDFAKEAAASGIGKRGLDALASAKYSKSVIRRDRNQKSFKKGFNAFYKLRTTGLQQPAKKKMRQYAKTLRAIEQKYGVQPEIIVTIWGMESGFGRFLGKDDIVDALATLTHDCRRTAFFRPNLMAALKIIDKRLVARSRLRGATHGEIGQTQFMAKHYLNYGVDWNRDGRRDLIGTPADVLASTANYLRGHGWKRGGDYQPGSHNFNVLKQWNAATVYQKAIAKFAPTIR
ncbi:MAG: lytic murein transglycosylase [Pseudomonadota bacterium]